MGADGNPELRRHEEDGQDLVHPTQAASVQLTVPVIASIGGIIFLSEAFSLRLFIASAAILSGVGLALLTPKKRKKLTQNFKKI